MHEDFKKTSARYLFKPTQNILYTSSSQSSGTGSLGNWAGDTVRERLVDPAPNVELWPATTSPDTSDEDLGIGVNTEGLKLVLAAVDVDDTPEATTEVHPRCVDPWTWVVVFLAGVTAAAAVGRQDDEEAALTALKSASFPRPEVTGVKKVERSGAGIRESMRRMTCTLLMNQQTSWKNTQKKNGTFDEVLDLPSAYPSYTR